MDVEKLRERSDRLHAASWIMGSIIVILFGLFIILRHPAEMKVLKKLETQVKAQKKQNALTACLALARSEADRIDLGNSEYQKQKNSCYKKYPL